MTRRSSNLKRAIDSGYPTYASYAILACTLAAKGNDAEAQSALAEARHLNPQLTIKFFAETMPALPIVIDGLPIEARPQTLARRANNTTFRPTQIAKYSATQLRDLGAAQP